MVTEDWTTKNAVWAAAYGAAYAAHIAKWHQDGQPLAFDDMLKHAAEESRAVADLAVESLE